MIELLLWASLSIAFSFLCSILEAVLLSVTPSYVKGQVNAKTSTGELLEEYKKDIDRPLSAILTLNTLAHTVGAIMVGATAGDYYGENYIEIAGRQVLSYEGLVAGVMTLLILLVSEIIPKTLGANNWRALVPFSVRAIQVILAILKPFVWISQFITRSLKKDKDKAVLSRADFLAMTEIGTSEGVLKDTESTIINNVLSFEKKTARDIMTPRSVTFMLEESMTVKDYMERPEFKTFSRVPIYSGEKDNVTGLILKDDALDVMARENTDVKLSELRRDIPTITDDMRLPDLLKRTSKDRKHLHIVTDDFGHVVGVVTMEDIFETLLGTEIVDESDVVVDLQAHAKEKWEKKNKATE